MKQNFWRHLDPTQVYVVYRFPNLKREWQPNADGKVGVRLKYSSKGGLVNIFRGGVGLYYKLAERYKSYWVPNFGGFEIIEEFTGTLKEAMSRERHYQKLYKSEDNTNSKSTREKSSQPKPQEQYECPVCGKSGGKNTMKQWGHGKLCTKKPLAIN